MVQMKGGFKIVRANDKVVLSQILNKIAFNTFFYALNTIFYFH